MKKLLFCFITVLMFFSCGVCLAHSGRTDGSGGHYDRSTGEYHYHHGYSAHQHPNGVCPYSSASKTIANPVSSNETSTKKDNNTMYIIAIIVSAVFGITFFAKYSSAKKSLCETQKQLDLMERQKQETINHYKDLLAKEVAARTAERYEQEKKDLFLKYNGIPLREFFATPSDMSINKKHEPFFKNKNKKTPWLAINSTHTIYHRENCSSAAKSKPIKPWNIGDARPCLKCSPPSYDFRWYEDYMQTRAKLSRYGLSLSVSDGDILSVVDDQLPLSNSSTVTSK